MIKNECKHEWDKHTGVKADGRGPYYTCNKCNAIMEISEVIQLETLEYLQGFQKWMSIIAIIISFSALFVSILVLMLKRVAFPQPISTSGRKTEMFLDNLN